MSTLAIHEPLIGELDHVRLSKLAHGRPGSELSSLLDAAEIVPTRSIPDRVVTLYTRAVVSNRDTDARHTLTLCYPQDADPASGFVSVLSPIGMALLGRYVGSTVTYTTPTGATHRLVIEELLFQPEASGDFSL